LSGVGVSPAASERPFWLRPPWMILFDLVKLRRLRPWDVDIAYLLDSLLGEIRRVGYINFSATGLALYSSASVYRMKTELILKLEEPVPPPQPKLEEYLPPPVQLPFRYEYTSTTVDDLLHALEDALSSEQLPPPVRLEPILAPPSVLENLDQFMVDIEDRVEEMFARIMDFAKGQGVVRFSKLVAGLKRLDIVRAFILLLFLASKERVKIWQEEEFGEIYISPVGVDMSLDVGGR
jgi:segregation and condensation protein A